MYLAITIIIIITCVLLVLVVLAQNPKGGGISAGLIGSGQIMGVKKTTDFVEKLTWGLALTLVVLCLVASLALPSKQERGMGSQMQEQIDNSGNQQSVPPPMPSAPGGQNQPGNAQPQQQQQQQQQPQPQPENK